MCEETPRKEVIPDVQRRMLRRLLRLRMLLT
jgi:hypothetical protein